MARARAPQSREGLLGIYLNDHLAGATGGVALAHRMAGSHHDPAQRMTLQRLASDIAHDRRALLDLMAVLELPVRRYKLSAAWAAEKAARLKLNGRLPQPVAAERPGRAGDAAAGRGGQGRRLAHLADAGRHRQPPKSRPAR